MLRVALIGAGDAGRHHATALAALHAAGELAWAAVGVRDVAKAVGFEPARACSPDDAIAASDAVIIATPDGLHRAHAEQALAAG
ncbi:MAG TPA: Gfo/Idh/MocA family oxidoreductase, partial [Kofleriaceae bacterium]